jgi:hypothetical protein
MFRFKKSCKKFLTILIFIIVTIQTYVLIVEFYLGQSRSTSNLASIGIGEKINKTIFFYESFKWMLNNRIYQYAAHLLVKNDKIFQIDSIIVTREDFSENSVKQAFRCVLKSIKNDYEKKYRISSVTNFVSNTKRIKCDVDLEIVDDISIAIINLFDFKTNSLSFSETDLDSAHLKLPESMINFQKSNLIFIPEKKLNQVAHCVHYTYNIVSEDVIKIMKWIDFQKKIGIKKIILYESSIHKLLENTIKKIYDSEFVEVRPYYINFDALCETHRLNILKSQDLVQYQIMKDQCEDAFYNVFDNPTYSSKNRWKHQKITSNDCYLSLQHVYQFVSYYDFDEIIYPRKFKIDNHVNFETNCKIESLCNYQNLKNSEKHDLYSFIVKLINDKSKSMNEISSLYFTNAVYLEQNFHVKKLTNDLKELIKNNQSYFQLDSQTIENSSIAKVHLKFTHHYGHFFLIYPKDYQYIKNLYDSYNLIECIHEKIFNQLDETLDPTFKRYLILATNREHHMGKSIHNTDNVFAVFTHYSTNVKSGTRVLEVSTTDGVLSHFRSDLFFLARQLKSSITNLKIDFEYYHHIISNYSNICTK